MQALEAIKQFRNRFLLRAFASHRFPYSLVTEKQTRIFTQQFFKPGDLVFDVGAYVGTKTNIYLANGAKVVCVEPQPDYVKILKRKFRGNKNLVIVPKGLASQTGILDMAICSQATTLSTFSKEWQTKGRFYDLGHTWDKIVSVEVTTLDELIKSYNKPQFCKIDVESFEYEVLKGLSQPIPYLSFEFMIENLETIQNCLNRLTTLGYRFFNLTSGEIPQFALKNWVSADTLLSEITNFSWGDIYAKYE